VAAGQGAERGAACGWRQALWLGGGGQRSVWAQMPALLSPIFRNVLNEVPKAKRGAVVRMPKAIYTQEGKEAARKKTAGVVQGLHAMKLAKAAMCLQNGLEETPVFYSLPLEFWRLVGTANMLERANKRDTQARQGCRGISWRQLCAYAYMRQAPLCRCRAYLSLVGPFPEAWLPGHGLDSAP